MCVKQGDLSAAETGGTLPRGTEVPGRAGVRASVVAKKSRNGDGAKERRKVDDDERTEAKLSAGSFIGRRFAPLGEWNRRFGPNACDGLEGHRGKW
jgi:hypothetical protein